MLGPIIDGMGRVLAYFYSVIPNYGLAIILLTIIVRVLMIPLAIKQAHSMQANRGNQEKMRQLAPEVKKIKEKFKNDRARQYEEQKKLYDKHGVNMLGGLSGCFPMLLQAPIFMAMYAVLQGCDRLLGGTCELGNNIPAGSGLHTAIMQGRDTFLAMNLNLTPAQVWGSDSFLQLVPYALLVGVMGGTMYFQTKQMMRMQPAAADPTMMQTQKIMQFMPLMIVVFSVNFPAGLTVYWTASNVWTIGQQFVLLKRFGTPPAEEEEKAKSPERERPRRDAKSGGTERGAGGGEAGVRKGEARRGAEEGKDVKGAGQKKGRPTPKRPPKGGGAQGRPRRAAAKGARPAARPTRRRGKAGGAKRTGARKPNKGQG